MPNNLQICQSNYGLEGSERWDLCLDIETIIKQ